MPPDELNAGRFGVRDLCSDVLRESREVVHFTEHSSMSAYLYWLVYESTREEMKEVTEAGVTVTVPVEEIPVVLRPGFSDEDWHKVVHVRQNERRVAITRSRFTQIYKSWVPLQAIEEWGKCMARDKEGISVIEESLGDDRFSVTLSYRKGAFGGVDKVRVTEVLLDHVKPGGVYPSQIRHAEQKVFLFLGLKRATAQAVVIGFEPGGHCSYTIPRRAEPPPLPPPPTPAPLVRVTLHDIWVSQHGQIGGHVVTFRLQSPQFGLDKCGTPGQWFGPYHPWPRPLGDPTIMVSPGQQQTFTFLLSFTASGFGTNCMQRTVPVNGLPIGTPVYLPEANWAYGALGFKATFTVAVERLQ